MFIDSAPGVICIQFERTLMTTAFAA